MKNYFLTFIILLSFATISLSQHNERNKRCDNTVQQNQQLCLNSRYSQICNDHYYKKLYQGQNYVTFSKETPAYLYYQFPKPDQYILVFKICSKGITQQSIKMTALKQSPRSWGQPSAQFETIFFTKDNSMKDDRQSLQSQCLTFSSQSFIRFEQNKDCTVQLFTLKLQKDNEWWFNKSSQLGVRLYFQIYGYDQISSIFAGFGLMVICLTCCCCLVVGLIVVKLIQSIANHRRQQNARYVVLGNENYNNNLNNNRYPQQQYFNQNNPNIPYGIQMNNMDCTDSRMQAQNGIYNNNNDRDYRPPN